MQRRISAVWEQFLPATFVVIHMRPGRSVAARNEVMAGAKPGPRAPHEIDVARLVKKLVDIGPFVGDDPNAKLLVLQRDRAVAGINEFGYATAIVAVVIVGLIG